jgi:predicted nucleic acid-binding protein
MDIVIDTSIIIAVITNEPTKTALIEHTTGATLHAPASIPWEIGNAFSAMFKRKRVTLAQATLAIEAYQQIPIRFIDVDLKRALALAEQLNIYAYDAYLIACALDLNSPLLTLDSGLINAARTAGVDIIEVTK